MSKRRPSAATVIASIALFVSLGGVSYGVASGSIGSREIKNNAVRSVDVRNGTLTDRDIGRSTLRRLRGAGGPQGQQGPQGPQGPQGIQGSQGAPGQSGISGYEVVEASSQSNSNEWQNVEVLCPPGKKVLGGGAQAFSALSENFVLDASKPLAGDAGWYAQAQETSAIASPHVVHAFAICAHVK